MRKNLKLGFIALILLVNTMFAANIPNSGNLLNQVESNLKPTEMKTPPPIPIEEYTPAITGNDTIKVMVKEFQIVNNTVFSTEVLHELIKEYEGKELTLLSIKRVADIITQYYRKHGYFVARAYIPAQKLDDNILIISIIEGHYGTFHIDNSSSVSDSTISRYFSKLDEQDVISMDALERQIYLIDSLSGVSITNTEIFPGEIVGSSDFTITTKETKKFEGNVGVDNYGNRYTGEGRASAYASLSAPFGLGDAVNVYVLSTFTGELKYGRASYSLPLGGSGVIFDIGMSGLKYTLGDIYKPLDAYGDATVLDAGLSYPIIKTQTSMLDIEGRFTHRKMSDWMNTQNDKKSVNDFTLSLKAYKSMNLFNMNSSLNGVISFTQGHKFLDSSIAQVNDAIIHTAGDFSKVNLNLTQRLHINRKTILTATLNGQIGFNKNLDSSQEFTVGGPYGLRAYTDNELSGDEGVLFSLEGTRALPSFQGLSHQAGVFYDAAKVWKNTVQWTGLIDNTRVLNDIGISYSASYKFINLKASYAHGFGSDAEPISGGSQNKLFAQLFLLF